jgi:acetolactate synthase-1/3 small subunit
MTIVCDASAEAGHRIRASLYKLENVVDVDDIAQAPSVTRELALIKVAATPRNRSQIFELVEVFRARIVDLAPESLMIEMTGVESKIEGLIQVLNEGEARVLEICRSGKMTMRRGHHTSGVLRALGAGTDDPTEHPVESVDVAVAAEPE